MNAKFSAKCVALIAAVAMSMSLAACSGGSMDDSSSSNGSAANSDTITLGSVTTNSGTAAAYGEAEVAGFKLAVDEINAKGGINGKKVKLESMDDKGDATEASNAFNKLAGDNSVLGVVGPTISSTTAAVAPLADQSKLPAIAPAATSDSIETGGYMFRTCFKDSYQGEIAAKFAAETLKVKKVAVLYGTGDPYSSGVGEAFAKAAEPYIRQTVTDPRFDTAAIAALLQARCEKLTDIPEKVDFFDALPEYPVDYYTNKKSKTNPDVSRAMLEAVIPVLEGLTEWTDEAIHDALVDLAQRLEVKNATLMWPVRIAAAGKLVTPGGAVEICRILGKDETLRRLNAGLAMLGA